MSQWFLVFLKRLPLGPHPSPLPLAGEGGRSSPWGVCNQRGIDARVYEGPALQRHDSTIATLAHLHRPDATADPVDQPRHRVSPAQHSRQRSIPMIATPTPAMLVRLVYEKALTHGSLRRTIVPARSCDSLSRSDPAGTPVHPWRAKWMTVPPDTLQALIRSCHGFARTDDRLALVCPALDNSLKAVKTLRKPDLTSVQFCRLLRAQAGGKL